MRENKLAKWRSIGIPRASMSKAEEDPAFKKKLDRELGELVGEGCISTETADAQAAIAGLCEPKVESPTRKRKPRVL